MAYGHTPVLLADVIQYLDLKNDDTVLDGTVGAGGHAEAILNAFSGTFVGFDRDADVLVETKRRLAPFGDRALLYHGNYADALTTGIRPTKILLDLGLSSVELERSGRGFSFQRPDEPLDMRFNAEEAVPTAADILNTEREEELARIFRAFGEERRPGKLAAAVVAARRTKRFATVADLLALFPARFGKTHPATRAFQALRIAVNHELDALQRALPQFIDALPAGGRIVVITFHSLEDRIAKRCFKDAEANHAVHLLTKHVVKPSRAEQLANPRSRSAKLRAAQKQT